MSSGIYQIKNLINGKIYVGSAKNLNQRWNRYHKKQLLKNIHNNPYLQHSWNKYGELNFMFEVLEYCSEENLIIREQWWIDNSPCMYYQHGYNICPTAGSMFGFRHSEESKKKISKNNARFNLGRHFSEEHKRRIGNSQLGEKNHMYGKHHAEETKKKVSELFSGENNPFYGKKHSEEIKNKIREAQTGKKASEETKIKMKLSAQRGEDNKNSKLTWDKVKQIREDYMRHNLTKKLLSIKYQVDPSTISAVIRNKTWKDQ